jgi:ABC-type sugar transport system substrate-binding protein
MHLTFDDYAKSLLQAFESVLQPTDVLYEVADANADGERQAEQIRVFTAKRVDALVVVPIDDAKIVDAVNQASAAGIPVISVTAIPNAQVRVTIAGNDRRNGAAAAELLVRQLKGRGDVLVFGKSGHTHRIDERLAGFDQVMTQSGLKVIEYYHSLSRPAVIDRTVRVLSEYPTVKGIFAVAGFHAQSIATALRKMGRRDIVVTAVDANKEVLQLIREGYVTGVAAQYPWMHGEYAAKICLDFIHKKPARSIPDMLTVVITEKNVDLGLTLLGPQYARVAPTQPLATSDL